MINKLREFMAHRQKKSITAPERISSAVLLPIYNKEGQCHILLTQRTNNVKEHKGQISFPGGARQDDESLLATALRESQEEVGLSPGEVEVLGELDDTATTTSNFVVTPFVGVIPWPNDLRADGWETDEIIEVPIAVLLDEKVREEKEEVIGGQPVTSYFYHYDGRVIWGATARILHQFLGLYQRAMAA
ncbi:MAG: CoA pyrophosphatase [Dehalococcoidia bacterium]|jgi:8-oxo-dGTP pyrophosphatase MutT (NUDIX family)